MFSIGDTVFFHHPNHSWILGKVDALTPTGVTCVADDEKRGVKGGPPCTNLSLANVTTVLGSSVDENVEDLLRLTVLHDATLLRCLFLRYSANHIYTNIGAIVVALNPFTFSIPWYQDSAMAKYLEEGERIERNLPHSWAVAHNTFFELIQTRFPQFILVSGESGSGKTEASKMVVKYFTALCKKRGSAADGAASELCGVKVQQCSPILEAFGNARTVRNDNSSRFGKFMKLQFTPGEGLLIGSVATRYLLEKSRIIMASKGERVYHSFYLVTKGSMAVELGVQSASSFTSLTSGQQLENGDFDTAEDFNGVSSAMSTVGLSPTDIRSTWCVTAGILYLLCASFVPTSDSEGSQPASASAVPLNRSAKLFGFNEEALTFELTQTKIVIRGETAIKRMTVAQSVDSRDALAKALYDSLFGWLVSQCNAMCDGTVSMAKNSARPVIADPTTILWVGLLDIFGFEDFEKNSFEQLCINLANETLQGHYNTYVFEKDLEECKAENIDTIRMTRPDNSGCIALVASTKDGLLALLDDECALGKGSDAGFFASTTQTHLGHASLVHNKISKTTFGVRHYAGTVTYDVTGWLEKNRDTMKDGLKLLCRGSADPIISQLVPAPDTNRQGRAPTVGVFFRSHLSDLMAIINSSNPHWIRCIKPNPQKKPGHINGVTTMQQLESSGVLGTVKIRKAGYPVRILFAGFVARYSLLLDGSTTEAKRRDTVAKAAVDTKFAKTACVDVLICAGGLLDGQLAQMGLSKVFMKAEALTIMETKLRTRKSAIASIISNVGRGYLTRLGVAQKRWITIADCMIQEFRAYLARTKAIREERAKRMKVLVEERSKLHDELMHQHLEAQNSLFAVYNAAISKAIDALIVATTLSAERRAAEIEESEDRERSLFRVRFDLMVHDGRETAGRSSIAYQHAVDIFWLQQEVADQRLEYTESTQEPLQRQSVEAEEALARAVGPVAHEALKGVESEQHAVREGLFVAYRRELYAMVLAPLHSSQRYHFTETWSANHERSMRYGIQQDEDATRAKIERFYRHQQWFAALATVEHDEGYDRRIISGVTEHRLREELQDAFAREWTALAQADYARYVERHERAVRAALETLDEQRRSELWRSRRGTIDLLQRIAVERDELTFRHYLVTAEAAAFDRLLRNLPSLQWLASVAEVEQEERVVRVAMVNWERRRRSLDLTHSQQRLLAMCAENTLRRQLVEAFRLNYTDLYVRHTLIVADAAVRSRLKHAWDQHAMDRRAMCRQQAFATVERYMWLEASDVTLSTQAASPSRPGEEGAAAWRSMFGGWDRTFQTTLVRSPDAPIRRYLQEKSMLELGDELWEDYRVPGAPRQATTTARDPPEALLVDRAHANLRTRVLRAHAARTGESAARAPREASQSFSDQEDGSRVDSTLSSYILHRVVSPLRVAQV